jgi:hypothetical protein
MPLVLDQCRPMQSMAIRGEFSQFGWVLVDLAQVRLAVLDLAILVRPFEWLVFEWLFGAVFSIQSVILQIHILILALNVVGQRVIVGQAGVVEKIGVLSIRDA